MADRPLRLASAAVAATLTAAITAYRVALSPFLGGQCRYHPSCSRYALDAIGEHGPWRGAWLATRRVCRCHPFVKGGYDPVPPRMRE